MYLMRQIGATASYRRAARLHGVPRLEGIALVLVGLGFLPGGRCFLVLLVPGLLAFVFGYFAFRSRIKGVYFSIITQALTYAAMLLFFRNETGFGGNNGFTDFKRILGVRSPRPTNAPRCSPRPALCLLLAHLPAGRYLVTLAFGRVLARRSATPRPG
jgi:urea transport system permease protein